MNVHKMGGPLLDVIEGEPRDLPSNEPMIANRHERQARRAAGLWIIAEVLAVAAPADPLGFASAVLDMIEHATLRARDEKVLERYVEGEPLPILFRDVGRDELRRVVGEWLRSRESAA